MPLDRYSQIRHSSGSKGVNSVGLYEDFDLANTTYNHNSLYTFELFSVVAVEIPYQTPDYSIYYL